MRGRAAAILVLAVAALPAAALALPAAASALPGAHLQGTFRMRGRVTVAHNVRGEHVGQRVSRTWTFTPLCAVGACARVRLARQRAAGVDHLVLHRTARRTYAGSDTFYAPVRCDGVKIARGFAVSFRITVKITRTAVVNGVVLATTIHATYTNPRRVNLTDCVAVPGHDAARYTGHRAP